MLIDIGGTPAKIIEEDNFSLAKLNGIPDEDLIAILDPFDLSRLERTIVFGGKKIKFPVNSKDVSFDSGKEPVIICDDWPSEIKKVARASSNLRDLMNNLVKLFYPGLKTILLEEILSKNKEVVYAILKKTKIPVRAICPKCGRFWRTALGENTPCCGVLDNEIIESGKYIPEAGFFSVITYLCGYRMFSNSTEKARQSEEIRKILGFQGNPLVSYIKQDKLNGVVKKEAAEEDIMASETVKGFDDYTGEAARKRARIKRVLEETFERYGFEPAETPVVEFESFVKGDNAGDEAVSDIFRLRDKGERELALRYEFTFQLKRIAKNKKLPYRRYQIGPVFRDEPISANRFREFVQCDADIVGSTLRDEAELLAMTSEILKKLGIGAEICINNRKLLNEVLDKLGVKDKPAVLREVDKLDKIPDKEIIAALDKLNVDGKKILKLFKNKPAFFKKYGSYEQVETLQNCCKDYGIELVFRPNLVRGLSYYNGLIFEIKTKKMKETICAGGSYITNGAQSTGLAFGLARLAGLAEIDSADKRIVILSIGEDKKAVKLAEKLRNLGKQCIIFFDKVSKALEFANSNGLKWVIIAGKNEAPKFKLKDMKSGKEKLVDEKSLMRELVE